MDEPNGIHHPGERAFFTAGHFLQGLTGIDLHGEKVRQRLGLRKADGFHVDGRVGDARVEQILGVLAVGDGEVATVAELVSVQAQDADPDRMEGAAPKIYHTAAQQVSDPFHHFAG